MKKFLILLLLFSACKKSEDRSCWKFVGEETEKIVQLTDFNKVEINPNIIVDLVQDTMHYCVISGGDNVVNLVETEISNGKLVLSNKNKCKFLRSAKKKIKVEVHFVSLEEIVYQGSEPIKSIGEITVSTLTVDIKETSGTVYLQINVDNISVSAEPSWANFILSGTTQNAMLVVKGNAYCDTRNLLVQDKIVINSRTVGDCYINGNTGHLKCETNGSGNVYYTGSPEMIEWNDYATGKLLQAP